MQQQDHQQQIPQPGHVLVERVSAKEFAAKFQSKRECYNFLASDVGIYLPPYDNVTIYFLRELMGHKKKRLHTT